MQRARRKSKPVTRYSDDTPDDPRAVAALNAKKERTEESRLRFAIGTRIRKFFPQLGWRDGRIESHRGRHYLVEYDDDIESEEMQDGEIERLVVFERHRRPASSTSCTDKRKFTASPTASSSSSSSVSDHSFQQSSAASHSSNERPAKKDKNRPDPSDIGNDTVEHNRPKRPRLRSNIVPSVEPRPSSPSKMSGTDETSAATPSPHPGPTVRRKAPVSHSKRHCRLLPMTKTANGWRDRANRSKSVGNASAKHSNTKEPERTHSPERKRKLTTDDRAFIDHFVDSFHTGLLDLPRGIVLRTYLSNQVGCDPVLLTDDLLGGYKAGSAQFKPLPRTPTNRRRLEQAQSTLQELEKRMRQSHGAQGMDGSSQLAQANQTPVSLSQTQETDAQPGLQHDDISDSSNVDVKQQSRIQPRIQQQKQTSSASMIHQSDASHAAAASVSTPPSTSKSASAASRQEELHTRDSESDSQRNSVLAIERHAAVNGPTVPSPPATAVTVNATTVSSPPAPGVPATASPAAHSTPQSQTSRPAKDDVDRLFPSRLYDMLENAETEGYHHIISWRPSGNCFQTYDTAKLEKEVLPKFTNQHSYRSFTRQLNIWGFERCTLGLNKGAYGHSQGLFKRGHEHLCRKMVRKQSSAASSKLHEDKAALPPATNVLFPAAYGNTMPTSAPPTTTVAMMSSASKNPTSGAGTMSHRAQPAAVAPVGHMLPANGSVAGSTASNAKGSSANIAAKSSNEASECTNGTAQNNASQLGTSLSGYENRLRQQDPFAWRAAQIISLPLTPAERVRQFLELGKMAQNQSSSSSSSLGTIATIAGALQSNTQSSLLSVLQNSTPAGTDGVPTIAPNAATAAPTSHAPRQQQAHAAPAYMPPPPLQAQVPMYTSLMPNADPNAMLSALPTNLMHFAPVGMMMPRVADPSLASGVSNMLSWPTVPTQHHHHRQTLSQWPQHTNSYGQKPPSRSSYNGRSSW